MVQLLLAIPGLLVSALMLATGDELWWLPAVGAALVVVGAMQLGPVIRRADERGPLPEAELPARRRRAERITVAMLVVMTAIVAVIFSLTLGLGGAIFMVAILLVGGSLGLWAGRRMFWRP